MMLTSWDFSFLWFSHLVDLLFRLAFFCRSEEQASISALLALRKSDRRAIPSLLTLLRLESLDQDEQEILNEHMYDPEEV